MSVYFEGSPQLGYASRAQIQEHVEQMVEEDATTRLFDVVSEDKIKKLGRKVFRQMLQRPMSERGEFSKPNNSDQFVMYDDDSMLGTFAYEVGRRDKDEELGDLINLDYLKAAIDGSFRLPPGSEAPHFTAQVEPVVNSFLEERSQFLGATQAND